MYPTPGPDQCMYSFTVPASALSAQCMTEELKNTLAKVKVDYDSIKKENHDLKEQIDTMEKEYRDMINTVKLLKKETATWRTIVSWPQLDEKFKPDDLTLIMKDNPVYTDCADAMSKGNSKAGIYKLQPKDAKRSFYGFCDEEGWTVVFRRFDGNVSFERNWNDFSGGFGELSGEFFIGLENLNMLTAEAPSKIHVEAMGWNNKMYEAIHEDFQVLDEMTAYTLAVGNMTEGNYLDVLSDLNGTKFTTIDKDNDEWFSDNCATYYKGGWWLKNCGFDPSRQWCDGGGCMSWGDVNIKKIIIKIRNGGGAPSNVRKPKERKKEKKEKKPKRRP